MSVPLLEKLIFWRIPKDSRRTPLMSGLVEHGVSREDIRAAIKRRGRRRVIRRRVWIGLALDAISLVLLFFGTSAILLPDWMIVNTIRALNAGLAFSHVRSAAVMLLENGRIHPISWWAEGALLIGGVFLLYIGSFVIINRREGESPFRLLLRGYYWGHFRAGLSLRPWKGRRR